MVSVTQTVQGCRFACRGQEDYPYGDANSKFFRVLDILTFGLGDRLPAPKLARCGEQFYMKRHSEL